MASTTMAIDTITATIKIMDSCMISKYLLRIMPKAAPKKKAPRKKAAVKKPEDKTVSEHGI